MTVTENAQCELQGMFSPTFGKASAHQICLYSYKSNVNTIYEDTRCCASLSLLSVLWKRYLKKVRVIAMCVLQLNCSDMQIGTDLLRRQKKKETKQMSNSAPLNWGPGVQEWVGRDWLVGCTGLMYSSKCAKTHISALIHVWMCECVFIYAIMSFFRHHHVTASSFCHPAIPTNAHTRLTSLDA